MVAATTALEHQGAVGVVRIKKFRHGNLALLKMLRSMQAAGQKTLLTRHRGRASSFSKPLVDAV
jgi:hypothetical protein